MTDIICLDYETIELQSDGSTKASTEAYRENFRVSSCAFAWNEEDTVVSEYYEGEPAIRDALIRLVGDKKVPVVCHNIPFEMMVTQCRFAGVDIDWRWDTMRLVQVWDNGGSEFEFESLPSTDPLLSEESEEKRESISGLSLVKSLKRVFRSDYESHKERAYEWIRQNVPDLKKGKEGAYLDRLPQDIAKEYNCADTEWTLRLYRRLLSDFGRIGFDPRLDHSLYLSSVKLIVGAKIRGIRVAREALSKYRDEVAQEIEEIGRKFINEMASPISIVERGRLRDYWMAPKTAKGRHKRLMKALHDPAVWAEHVAFNPGSNKQLADLFVRVLGIVPKFMTDKGQPSFKSAMLNQWGPGGEMLLKRRKRGIVLAQVESLLALSEYDGRWHSSLRAAGTKSGRYVGSQ